MFMEPAGSGFNLFRGLTSWPYRHARSINARQMVIVNTASVPKKTASITLPLGPGRVTRRQLSFGNCFWVCWPTWSKCRAGRSWEAMIS